MTGYSGGFFSVHTGVVAHPRSTCPALLNVNGGIMVTMRNKTAVDTTVLSGCQRLAHATAALGAILRRIGRIHLDHFTASIRSFACEDHGELIPARVTDAFGEMVIADHPADVQIFDGDVVVTANQVERRLVVKVGALPFDVQVRFRQNVDGLAAPVASFVLSARNSTLCRLQFFFGGAVMFRVINSVAIGDGGKTLYPQINPRRLASLRNETRLVAFDGEDHIPAIGFAFDRAGFDFTFNRTGKTDTARADLAQVQFVAFQSETALRIDKRIEERLAFESRVARLFTRFDAAKEVVERLLAAAQNVLKHLTVDGGNVGADGLDVRKLCRLRVIVERNMVDLIGVPAFLKRSVIEFTASIERRNAGLLKPGIDF